MIDTQKKEAEEEEMPNMWGGGAIEANTRTPTRM